MLCDWHRTHTHTHTHRHIGEARAIASSFSRQTNNYYSYCYYPSRIEIRTHVFYLEIRIIWLLLFECAITISATTTTTYHPPYLRHYSHSERGKQWNNNEADRCVVVVVVPCLMSLLSSILLLYFSHMCMCVVYVYVYVQCASFLFSFFSVQIGPFECGLSCFVHISSYRPTIWNRSVFFLLLYFDACETIAFQHFTYMFSLSHLWNIQRKVVKSAMIFCCPRSASIKSKLEKMAQVERNRMYAAYYRYPLPLLLFAIWTESDIVCVNPLDCECLIIMTTSARLNGVSRGAT